MDKIDKRIALWVVIGVLFIVALFLVFKAGAGSAVSVGSAAKSVASSSAGMVGGC